jgi:hypothetical protein
VSSAKIVSNKGSAARFGVGSSFDAEAADVPNVVTAIKTAVSGMSFFMQISNDE